MASSRDARLALDRIGVPGGGHCLDGGETVYDRIVNNIDELSYTPKEQKSATDHIEAIRRQLNEENKRELEKLRGKQGQLVSQIADLMDRLLDKSLLIAELKDELNAANKRDESPDLEPSDCGCEPHLDAPAYPERLRLAFRVIENHFDCHQITNGEALALSVLRDELSP